MATRVRVKLVTGDTHTVTLDMPEAPVLNVLEQGGAPFSGDWVQADNNTIVRISAIVSVTIEHSRGEPLVASV